MVHYRVMKRHLKEKHGWRYSEESPNYPQPVLPKPQDILIACAKLQKAGADLSEMTIVHDQDDMTKFWVISKKDLRRNNLQQKTIDNI